MSRSKFSRRLKSIFISFLGLFILKSPGIKFNNSWVQVSFPSWFTQVLTWINHDGNRKLLISQSLLSPQLSLSLSPQLSLSVIVTAAVLAWCQSPSFCAWTSATSPLGHHWHPLSIDDQVGWIYTKPSRRSKSVWSAWSGRTRWTHALDTHIPYFDTSRKKINVTLDTSIQLVESMMKRDITEDEDNCHV